MSPLTSILAQNDPYIVRKVPWCSDKYDEFSPVYYKKGLVFCSNKNANPISYSTENNTGLFNINYIDTTAKDVNDVSLFANSLSSRLNDGPVAFNRAEDTIYFSRNQIVEGSQKEISGPRNRLGVYFAVLQGNKWTNINEMRFNSDSYNSTTPYLSPDGRLLYFASDRPDGFGGSDLYVCFWENGYWSNPENLGPVINTEGNEAYPFVNEEGGLFFSSDGQPGAEKKDVYFSKYVDSAWITPVKLSSPVNSAADDFGYVSKNENEGYFSSSRSGSVDIYRFKTTRPLFLYCAKQRKNSYCFGFPDDLSIDIDPLIMQFQWDFGDGAINVGYVGQHCFPGKGIYNVRQNIIDKKTGRFIFNKQIFKLELKDFEQPYIKAPSSSLQKDSVKFDAGSSNLPGKNILAYYWDFGDGERSSGEVVRHKYMNDGLYNVKLAVQTADNSSGKIQTGCISSIISIGNIVSDNSALGKNYLNIADFNFLIDTVYSSSKEMSAKAIYQVVVESSKSQLKSTDKIFSPILSRYAMKEVYQPEENLYRYIIDEGLSFMDVYPSYSDAESLGYGKSYIRTFILRDSAELELWNIKKTYGTSTDNLFKSNDPRLISGKLPVLDKVAGLMIKNKNMKLHVAVHTDNTGIPASNFTLSLNRARSITDYLVKKGVSSNRIIYAGYGGSRPVASNYSEAERKRNRRFDIAVLSNK